MARAGAGDEQQLRVPSPPGVLSWIRIVLSDLYSNAGRLVPANVVWGVGLLAVVTLLVWWVPAGILAASLLAIPAAGIFRLTALIVRGDPVSFADAFRYRLFAVPALGAGAVVTVLTVISVVNVAVAAGSRDALGWSIASLALWGIAFVWMLALCFWPILLDPRRAGLSLRQRARLAAIVLFVHPLRLILLGVIVAALIVISTLAFPLLLTVTIALVALLASHYVLPAADHLEGRATEVVPDVE